MNKDHDEHLEMVITGNILTGTLVGVKLRDVSSHPLAEVCLDYSPTREASGNVTRKYSPGSHGAKGERSKYLDRDLSRNWIRRNWTWVRRSEEKHFRSSANRDTLCSREWQKAKRTVPDSCLSGEEMGDRNQ
jgi:hypothetical protein